MNSWVLVTNAYGDWELAAESATYRDAVINAQIFLDTNKRPNRIGSGYYELKNACIVTRNRFERGWLNK
jgi:hypothetical protein